MPKLIKKPHGMLGKVNNPKGRGKTEVKEMKSYRLPVDLMEEVKSKTKNVSKFIVDALQAKLKEKETSHMKDLSDDDVSHIMAMLDNELNKGHQVYIVRTKGVNSQSFFDIIDFAEKKSTSITQLVKPGK